MSEPLPEHGPCFICGTANPRSLGLRWYEESREDGLLVIYSDFQFDEGQQGPPKHAHGGASAAVIDEVMGVVAWRSGLKVVLANLSLDYRRPVPLNVPLRVEGWVKDKDERKAYTYGRLILPDGHTAVSGTGLYIQAPHLFTFDFYHARHDDNNRAEGVTVDE